MDILTKKQAAEIRSLYTRHGRKKSDFCVCEGLRACGEILKNCPDLIHYAVATQEGAAKAGLVSCQPTICSKTAADTTLALPYLQVEAAVLESLSSTMQSQGILLVLRVPSEPEATEICPDPFILALDKIGDPGNFGTICRTAKAANLSEIWYTRGSVDPYSDKVIRAAMGAQFLLKLRSFESLSDLRSLAKTQGFGRFCVSTPHGGESCFRAAGIFDKTVMVIGSEGHGVTDIEADALKVMIPMPGQYESLNAAQAATILIFESVRRVEEMNLKGLSSCN